MAFSQAAPHPGDNLRPPRKYCSETASSRIALAARFKKNYFDSMKIAICVDPFSTSAKDFSKLIKEIKKSIPTLKGVKLVYVSSRADSILNTSFDHPKKDRYTKIPFDAIAELVKKAGQGLKTSDIHVFFEDTTSKKDIVKRLERECRKMGIETLAIYSHQKNRIDRFLLGSFSEQLLHHSALNILAVK